MKKLTRRQLINSLVFPIMTVVWALPKLVLLFIFYGFDNLVPTECVFIAAIVVGGILCGVFTAALGIETGQYFLPRLWILISTIFVSSVAGEFLGGDPKITFFLLLVSNVINAVFFVKRTRFSEWLIIFFSNPVLYCMVGVGIEMVSLLEYQQSSSLF